MILLNPKTRLKPQADDRSREILEKTVEFFERKGKERLQEDYHARVWYADFLDFVKKEGIFKTVLTPRALGDENARWDTWRNSAFAELLGFYGLPYWYTWQVSVLGLGPLFMTKNEDLKRRAAAALADGGIFAFGLSEKAHGADIYSSDMNLTPQEGGGFVARGGKYYIGNGNKAAIVSTFGKVVDSEGNSEKGDYLFFATDPTHEKYECIKNVVASQSYVAQYELYDYPVAEEDVLFRGRDAWDAALNTINIGKYNLGWASIGMCTHSLYEAIHHAANRNLYGMYVTDFAHVKRLFTDAYARLVAMKLFALRASDYMRSASHSDRRYLLYNPMVKMKVTTEGERVMNHMWDVIAAKGFEKDMFFEQAAIDIRALPKLEGTVHVNIALLVKFMPSYFFAPEKYPEIPKRDDAAYDSFLFDQGPTKGLGQITFHDYRIAYSSRETPNLAIFCEQIEVFRGMLETNPPGPDQMKDVDFLLSAGQLFALVVYGQLILENAGTYDIDDDTLDQIFDVLVRDFSAYALDLHGKATTNEAQAKGCLEMIRRPAHDPESFERVWKVVHALKDDYEMSP